MNNSHNKPFINHHHLLKPLNKNVISPPLVAGSSNQEGTLIDLSPEELANAAAAAASVIHPDAAACRRVVNILDEPIDIAAAVAVVAPQEYWPDEDPRTYANCPDNNAAMGPPMPDPFDTSRVFTNPPQSRYYSQVTPDLPPSCYYSTAPAESSQHQHQQQPQQHHQQPPQVQKFNVQIFFASLLENFFSQLI